MADGRPSLGFALIARNASGTLGACLDSIRPVCQQIVVGVDTLTDDDTAAVAKAHGADVVVPVEVSTPHTCPQHGTVLAQHFAHARNQSFLSLDPALDWWAWIDSDDVLEGAERLPDLLASAPAEIIGIWLPYDYSRTNGVTNTRFHRERLLRPAVGWRWEERVHEVVKPLQEGPWLQADAVVIAHQEGVHKTESSTARNLLLLEIDNEERPDHPRTVFYIANQYFAMGAWEPAAHWYERLVQIGDNPYERWQSYLYLSKCYQRQGDLDAALQAAFGALDENPTHPEPYFEIAGVYLQAGEHDKAVWWTQQGRTGKTPPPFFVFKNPLDYSFNNRVCLADALAAQGHVTPARKELEAAFAALPDERIGDAITKYKGMEAARDQAQAFVALAQGRTDSEIVHLWETVQPPRAVRSFGRVRDVVMPAYLRGRVGTQPRIVFWCERSVEPWYPGSLDETGIGGSETAVIEIARRFAADGWCVDVYNGPGPYEGVYDGVGYWDPERFTNDESDVLVSWRQPGFATTAPFRASLLWCHDLNYGQLPEHVLPGLWDRVLGVSQWHADYLRQVYGVAADVVPNGIDPARFAGDVERKPWRCVYASSPDRGLERLLHLWPAICAGEPGAELHIAYGWETFDRMAATRPGMQAYKARILALLETTPQVTDHGRLGQADLARLYQSASAWLYPTNFLEVSCISAMEAMSAGAVPVATACGALPETVGSAGALVPGQPHSQAWRDFYVSVARGVLGDPNIREPLRFAAERRGRERTWDAAYATWRQIVDGLLSGREANAA